MVIVVSIFGSRLKYLRESKELTQKQLASIIGTSPVMICKYESSDDIYPKYNHLIALSKALNVSLDYLCGTEYYLNEDEAAYNTDESILKIIKRSKTLYKFILDDPRSNVQLLENYIKQIK